MKVFCLSHRGEQGDLKTRRQVRSQQSTYFSRIEEGSRMIWSTPFAKVGCSNLAKFSPLPSLPPTIERKRTTRTRRSGRRQATERAARLNKSGNGERTNALLYASSVVRPGRELDRLMAPYSLAPSPAVQNHSSRRKSANDGHLD